MSTCTPIPRLLPRPLPPQSPNPLPTSSRPPAQRAFGGLLPRPPNRWSRRTLRPMLCNPSHPLQSRKGHLRRQSFLPPPGLPRDPHLRSLGKPRPLHLDPTLKRRQLLLTVQSPLHRWSPEGCLLLPLLDQGRTVCSPAHYLLQPGHAPQ